MRTSSAFHLVPIAGGRLRRTFDAGPPVRTAPVLFGRTSGEELSSGGRWERRLAPAHGVKTTRSLPLPRRQRQRRPLEISGSAPWRTPAPSAQALKRSVRTHGAGRDTSEVEGYDVGAQLQIPGAGGAVDGRGADARVGDVVVRVKVLLLWAGECKLFLEARDALADR